MATKVVKSETVELLDGSEIEIRPLNIKTLRKFFETFKRFEGITEENQDEGLDIMLEAVSICMSRFDPEKADADYIEENMDMNMINRILFVAGGVDMAADPNQTRAG